MKLPIITCSIAALLGATTITSAQGDAAADRPARPMPKEIIEKFDADGDGKLNETERKAARTAMEERRTNERERVKAKFDKDGDGTLNDEERAAARKAMEERQAKNKPVSGPSRERIRKKFDKDGDGKLNDEELAAAKEAMKAQREKKTDEGGEANKAAE